MNLRSPLGYSYYLWVGFALVLIFSTLKPAGTEGSGLLYGAVIWAIQIGLLLPILVSLHILLQRNNSFNELNPWIKLILSGFFGSLVFVPLGLGIDYVFSLDDWSEFKTLHEIWLFLVEEFLGIVFPVIPTWLAINAPLILRLNFRDFERPIDQVPETSDDGDTSESSPEFFGLISKEIGNDILWIKAELHYIRVVTTLGEELVLYNLKDAIADLEQTVKGIQTHRSYWVASRHVLKMITEQRGKFVIIDNGKKVPVSRRKASEVKEFVNGLCKN